VTPTDYDYLRKLLKERSGLVLSADKQYLVESRLLPLVRKAGVANLGELVLRLQRSGTEPLVAEVVDAMTTNETFFFRDKFPFEHFRDVILPSLMAARGAQRHIRIWCAACSTGQEPYSLAMSLKEMGAALAGWRFDIVATDIAAAVIARATAGVYSQFEVQRGLPITLLLRYFQQDGERWQVVPELRAMVKFRQLNLLRDFSALGTFDAVFCRNVLIYFDHGTKTDVLDRIARSTQPDGFLVLGAAETVVGLTDRFKPHADRRGLYTPNPDAAPYRGSSNVIPLTPRIAAAAAGRA
jgi:chemotaxis protein methyltransferase CheR